VESGRNIQLEVEPGIFAYFDTYTNSSRMGYRFSLERFEDKSLVSKLTANSIKYDSLYNWTIIDYIVRDFDGMYEHISGGTRKDTTLMFVPEDFLISENDCETMTNPKLAEYITRQKQRGIGNIQTFEIEYHKRYANAFSFFILSVIGVSLASYKKKGGMGMNIGIGIGLSFSYILFMTITASFAVSGLVSPMIASWIPNILYTFIAIYLYRKAPR
jgi:lipopolysaccharide export system permease protein